MKKIISILIIALLLINCNNQPANKHEKLTDEEQKEINNLTLLSSEKAIEKLRLHCYSCHNPKSESHDNMLAPPLAGIKYKYKQHYTNRTEFIAKMSDFVNKPTKENAMMKGPVRRFGLMPKTTLTSKKEVYQLIAFIYDNPLEYPAWFPEHFEEQHGKPWDNK